MGKRIIWIVFLIALLLISLAGCGSNSGTVSQNDTPTSTESPTNDAYHEDEVKIKTDDYSKGTTQFTIQDLKYQIPSSWRIVKGEGEIVYYYPNSEVFPQIMVSFSAIDDGTTILDDNFLSDFLGGISQSYTGFTLSEKKYAQNSSGLKLGYAEFSGTLEGEDLDNITAAFDCQDGIAVFYYANSPESDKDYSVDFLKIVDSVERDVDLTKGDIGDFYVTIGDCVFTNDYDGNKAIVINYDFTNNSEETVVPLWKTSCRAFQDGIELDSAFIFDGSVYDAGIEQKNIRPGVTLTGCQKAYVLISDSPIEFEMGPIWGDPILQKTFTIN